MMMNLKGCIMSFKKEIEDGAVVILDEFDGYRQFNEGVNDYYDEWLKDGKLVAIVEGVTIFEYPDVLGANQYTFWYGRSPEQYVSSMKSEADCVRWIRRNGAEVDI